MSFDLENAKFIAKHFSPGNVRDAMADMVAEIEKLHVLNAELIEALSGLLSPDRRSVYGTQDRIEKARAILAKAQPSTET
jgi:hypothetical protein